MAMLKRLVGNVYRKIVKPSRSADMTFWILLSFIITFALARLTVRLAPELFLSVGHTHVHHFTYGFVILAVSGFMAITGFAPGKRWLAVVYGVGLALAVDETGMWLRLTDDYHNRLSFDAFVLLAAILINIVYFRAFWREAFKQLFRKRR